MRARYDLRLQMSTPKTARNHEEFFMVRSRSVHLRLLHLSCDLEDHEFYLRDFEQPGLDNDLMQASTEDVREERKGTNMGDTVILATVYFPVLTVGMVLLIIRWMSAAGSHPKR